jgi:hypothetical protein
VQRHRHDRIGARDHAGTEQGAETPGELLAERPAQVVKAVKFQMLDQLSDRTFVIGGPHERAQVAVAEADSRRPEHPLPAGETDPSTLAPWERADAEQAIGRKERLQPGSGEAAHGGADS